eukprot:767440-Hanusia_phi.AAC.2
MRRRRELSSPAVAKLRLCADPSRPVAKEGLSLGGRAKEDELVVEVQVVVEACARRGRAFSTKSMPWEKEGGGLRAEEGTNEAGKGRRGQEGSREFERREERREDTG